MWSLLQISNAHSKSVAVFSISSSIRTKHAPPMELARTVLRDQEVTIATPDAMVGGFFHIGRHQNSLPLYVAIVQPTLRLYSFGRMQAGAHSSRNHLLHGELSGKLVMVENEQLYY